MTIVQDVMVQEIENIHVSMDIQEAIQFMKIATDAMEEEQLQLHHVYTDTADLIDIVHTIQQQHVHHTHTVHMEKHHNMIKI